MAARAHRRSRRFDRYIVRREQSWPLTRTRHVPLYLAGSVDRPALSPTPAVEKTTFSYRSDDEDSRLLFDHRFKRETELTGHCKLRLWVSSPDANDMDIFVALEKLDALGEKVGFAFFGAYEHGPVALGWLRVSHREIDLEKSRPEQPYLTHQREMRLKAGEIVPVDIEIWPSSTIFRAGETLRVVIQGSDVYKFKAGTPTHRHVSERNRGPHLVHVGGPCDSHLLVPVC